MLNKFLSLVFSSVLALSLTACSPGEMSKEEAGKAYLDAVCPTNVALIWDKTQPYNYVNTINFLNKLLVNFKAETKALDEPSKPWPKDIAKEIKSLADVGYSDITELQSLLTSTNYYDLTNWRPVEVGNSPQKIRGRLGLNTDSKVTCKSYKAVEAPAVAKDLTASSTYIDVVAAADTSINWTKANFLGGLGQGYLGGYQSGDNKCQISEYDSNSNAKVSPIFAGRRGFVVDIPSTGHSLAVTTYDTSSMCVKLIAFMLNAK